VRNQAFTETAPGALATGRPANAPQQGGWQCVALVTAILLSVVAPRADAEPAFARMYKQQFGYQPSCNACHKDGGGTPVNDYGQQYKDAGMDMGAFETIAELDADADGFNNGEEASSRANPGREASTPKSPGDWLDTASLIPDEVQALFPDVKQYLPKDALLTDDEIARAADMGVSLGSDDQNTIYIPVVDRRPAGTALIFRATFDDRDFFLLMATDRKLRVTTVKPLNIRLVPEAKKANYARFDGQPVNELPAPEGDGINAAVTRAVRKAGTLLWVRLKGA